MHPMDNVRLASFKEGDRVAHVAALPDEDCHNGEVLKELGNGYFLIRWESGREVPCSGERLSNLTANGTFRYRAGIGARDR